MIIRSISELLAGRQLITIDHYATVEDACALMDHHNIGALVVTDSTGMCGILSERDVIRRWMARGLVTEATQVFEIMTPNPISIGIQQGIADALSIMLDKGFRHVPVIDRIGAAVGMISLRDIPTEYRVMVERFRSYQHAAAE
ncbi:MAG: CBS domain-containing protein [Pseudomonadota bacterium]